MKYEKWLKNWLNVYVKIGVKQRTFEIYQYNIDRYIKNTLGKYQLEKLNHIILQNFVIELSEQTENHKALSNNTVKLVWRLVCSSLKLANEELNIDCLCYKKVKLPITEERKISAFTTVEQKKIGKCLNIEREPKLIGILLGLYLGLRLGEICALKWEDIEFAN